MRATLLLLPALLIACGSGEDAAPVEETMPAETTAPAMLTASDVSGTWTGMTMVAGTDSVTSRWTLMSTSDTSGALVYEGTTDTTTYSVMFDADSMVATSLPFVDETREDEMMVMWRSVGRLQADGQLRGTVQTMVVGSTDVVSTGDWHATRATM